MKGKVLFVCLAFISLVSMLQVASALCEPRVSLLNQDPYPAIPGDYARIVFQVTGVDNPECDTVNFMLQQDYPISLDPGASPFVSLKGGAYLLDYGTFFLVPYKVRIDQDALDGNYTLKVNYGSNNNPVSLYRTSSFDLIVNDTHTDFDVFVDSYSDATKSLTLNIVNIGKNDANALTVKLPTQDGLNVTAGSDKTVGKLSATDDTTVTFTAIPDGTSSLKVSLYYTDLIGKRRQVDKIVPFTASSYASTETAKSSLGIYFYLLILTWVVVAGYWFFIVRRRKKKKFDSLRK